ncbi:MATE family efflux transporter [Gemmobacter lanyuensis]
MTQGQAKFVEGSLFRHVAVMSLTASVGLMAIFVVDLINMVYISWLRDPVLTAAVGYAGAVLFFTTAVGIGLSVGVSALVARAVGARDPALARDRATAGLVLSAGVGCIFAALVWLFLPAIVGLLGAEGRVGAETLWFLQLSVPGQPLLMVAMVGAAVLRAHGEARRSMMVTVWGAIVLAALDPVLILWANLGLTGAALAGWGSRLAMVVMALWPIWRRHGGFGVVSGRMIADLAPALGAISAPAVLTQLATPVGQAIITRMVAGYGEAAVAGMAIAGRLTPVAFGMIFALSGAIGPIIGQNLGAKRMDRVRRGFWDALLLCAGHHRHVGPAVSGPCAHCRCLPCRGADAGSAVSVLRAAEPAVLLQRHDLCRQCRLQQSGRGLPVDAGELGPPHAGDSAFCAVAGCRAWAAGVLVGQAVGASSLVFWRSSSRCG